MQRDDNRFDFPLDLEDNDDNNKYWKDIESIGQWKSLVAKILGKNNYSLIKFKVWMCLVAARYFRSILSLRRGARQQKCRFCVGGCRSNACLVCLSSLDQTGLLHGVHGVLGGISQISVALAKEGTDGLARHLLKYCSDVADTFHLLRSSVLFRLGPMGLI
jgi:hypothetical protein